MKWIIILLALVIVGFSMPSYDIPAHAGLSQQQYYTSYQLLQLWQQEEIHLVSQLRSIDRQLLAAGGRYSQYVQNLLNQKAVLLARLQYVRAQIHQIRSSMGR